MHAELEPLLGFTGVRALFARSAKLVRAELGSFSDVEILQSSAGLREHLLRLDPASVTGAAAALFGTFLTLLTTFIGDRLTIQVLRRAWPTIDETGPGEIKT